MFKAIMNNIESGKKLHRDDIIYLLNLSDINEIDKLFSVAYDIKLKYVGNKAYFRGIVELSNICEKDCYYCGIRKSNINTKRFLIPETDVISSAIWAYNANYGSVVLQSGERSDPEFIAMIERILLSIKEQTNGKLGVTISLGEQTEKTYQRWFEAGAHRYLLRIETSNKELYNKLHPKNHDFMTRLECLKRLKKVGYQVGTGVMIGLPFQTIENLADDILFFERIDLDMIGMGPFLFHDETPLNQYRNEWEQSYDKLLEMGRKMIAIARIHLKDVNIAATTVLQALKRDGRELGLKAGANIIMPNATDTKYRESYQLYENKPCTDENASMCRGCLQNRIEGIGETVGFNEWGDSPHFYKRTNK